MTALGLHVIFRLAHRLFVRPVARVAADVMASVVDGREAPAKKRRGHGRDWWTTTLVASAVCVGIGSAYAATVWPAALLWFAIAVALPVRGFSEGLGTVPYFLLASVLASCVPVVGWWLAGAGALAAVLAAAAAWARWRKAARDSSQVPAAQRPGL
ncbi:hypothetical protein GCM10012320_20470 [Sinomonas cellulolyticus]|uniref:Uncharacterized protein n=1 Tax=Sinomonas cellulolyticus TaxID=2801916 RepID=A0ABS1K268_9MICC|nr:MULTISPECIES: hypothetical protein [Sinomonas]MBL0705558.1 hypothetical protein [Sinomonas cellulolyticus]GHG51333.1 hypothetical protein GCM10012320_20470 [Sinomonas sp. KCTC 49339]